MKPVDNMVDEDGMMNKLHDDHLRRIIDLLPTKEALQTSVLSSRWQNLWRSISNIDLQHSSFLLEDEIDNSSFLEIIDRILVHHDSSNIKRFIVSCYTCVDAARIHRWISKVIEHNVEEFRLDCTIDETCILPVCLFQSESLTVLEIDMEIVLGSNSSLLFSVHMPNLKTLKLSRVRFLDNHSIQHFFSNVPKLQQLCLYDCCWEKVNRLIIDIPTLERVHVRIKGKNRLDCQVTVIAPSLTSFNCYTDFSIDFLISNHYLLLDVWLKPRYLNDGDRLALTRLLESVKKLASLRMTWDFSTWLSIREVSVHELPLCMNLMRLEISAYRYCSYLNVNIKNIFMFLHKTPNLQSININFPYSENAARMMYFWDLENLWSSNDVPSCVINKIRKVSISSKFDTYSTGGKASDYSTAMGLIKYFISHSRSLEMLEVNGLSHDSCLAQVTDELHKHPRYSELLNSSCSINVFPKPQSLSFQGR